MNEYTPQANTPQRYVYVIQSGDGPIKIGVAVDPEARRLGLQVGNPYPLTIRALIGCLDDSGAFAIEAALHRHFADVRMVGEWFDAAPEDVYGLIDLAFTLVGRMVSVQQYDLPPSVARYTKAMNARAMCAQYLKANPDAINMSARQLAATIGIGKTVAAEVMREYNQEVFSSNGNGHS